jgi:phosphatidylserine/phosphatidylglycerophosphate/cardiolipin synthase-like enzyme
MRRARIHGHALRWLLLGVGLWMMGPACRISLDPADREEARSQRVDAYFNFAGTRQSNHFNSTSDDVIVQMIDRTRFTIDVAAMGFSRRPVVDALVRAWRRGTRVRFVGDARHMHGEVYGYEQLRRWNIPFQVGNQPHIMHNKFFIFDDFMVYLGTGNITGTDIDRNDNSWFLIQSPEVAADFRAEFEQMFAGRFGAAKIPNNNGNSYQVGDSRVEVYFSPQEDALGRLQQAIRQARESIEFTIFAFTKDQVGSELVARHVEFTRYNQCCNPASPPDAETQAECFRFEVACELPFRPRYVRGVIDRSQLHSNGPYHEIYRLLTYGVPVRLDGNDNSVQPGDYQAGGGRLHSKTIVFDHALETGYILSGSFNWSTSATQSNDETMLVIHNARIASQFHDFFEQLWRTGRNMGNNWVGDGLTRPGDVVFNEVHWDGYNGGTEPNGLLTSNDEFIELLNTTDRVIDLSLWTISTDEDFAVGLYPGTIIGPHERFLIVDHNLTPFLDAVPQQRGGAFQNADFVMNGANDPRFLRINLHNSRLTLRLLDARGTVVDEAGDGGPPFHGGRTLGEDDVLRTYSMERIHLTCPEADPTCRPIGDGRLPESWQACQHDAGGRNVRPAFRDIVIATPGEPNSGGEAFPDEDPFFRSATGFREEGPP